MTFFPFHTAFRVYIHAATQGFKDALTEKLGEDGVKFEEGNASGESAN